MKFKPSKDGKKLSVELDAAEPIPVGTLSPAFNLNRILVPIDFSECSRKALTYALSFARQFGASIELIYVVETPPPIPGLMDFPQPNVSAAKAAREKLAELTLDLDATVRISARTDLGIPHEEIIRAAEEQNIDLIILGTHGRSGLRRFFLGSTTDRVLRHAGCPVLVVREHEHEFIPDAQVPAAKSQGRRTSSPTATKGKI